MSRRAVIAKYSPNEKAILYLKDMLGRWWTVILWKPLTLQSFVLYPSFCYFSSNALFDSLVNSLDILATALLSEVLFTVKHKEEKCLSMDRQIKKPKAEPLCRHRRQQAQYIQPVEEIAFLFLSNKNYIHQSSCHNFKYFRLLVKSRKKKVYSIFSPGTWSSTGSQCVWIGFQMSAVDSVQIIQTVHRPMSLLIIVNLSLYCENATWSHGKTNEQRVTFKDILRVI